MTLERAMRQTLAEMCLIQYGRVAPLGRSSGDTDRDPRPAGESRPMAEHWAAEWARSPTEDTLLMARAELDAWKRSVPRDEDHEYDLEQWVVDDGEGYAVAQVARKFGIAESRVRRIRLKKDRESEFGLPTLFAHHRESEADKHVRIVNLAAQGCTERQIAFQVGVGKSTVRRALGRAA